MNKKLIRLTEGDLHNLVKESVKILINEGLTPIFKSIAKEHGGVKWVDKRYQFDKLNFPINGWDYFFEAKGSDIPYRLLQFADKVMVFNDGKSLYAIKPEYHDNEEIKQMLKSSQELDDLRTAEGGYQMGRGSHEVEVDYGGGPVSKTFSYDIPQNQMRQKAHKRARGRKKPLARSIGDSDYNEYVKNYLCDKFNGVYLGGYIAVPVHDRWGEEGDAIRNEFMKYGYGEDESVRTIDIKYDLEYSDTGYRFDPDSDYMVFTKGKQNAFMEWDDPFGPYGTYSSAKLPSTPKIGTREFMRR